MTSMYPSIPYQDLIQTYNLRDVRVFPPPRPPVSAQSLLGFLQQPEYSLFRHMVNVSQFQGTLDDIQFQGTLLLPTDTDILKEFPMDMFMEMDRNTARVLLNYHIFPNIIKYRCLQTRRLSKLDTRDPKSEIVFECTPEGIYMNGGKARILEEIIKDNGTILKISSLLIPPEWYGTGYTLKF